MTAPDDLNAPVYSYTGNEDGDFVIWKGDQFVANVGASALAEVGKQQIAFDADKAHAELIVEALNTLAAIKSGDTILFLQQMAAIFLFQTTKNAFGPSIVLWSKEADRYGASEWSDRFWMSDDQTLAAVDRLIAAGLLQAAPTEEERLHG